MGSKTRKPAVGLVISFSVIFALGTYFTFASVQGDFGLFRRIQIDAEYDALLQERDQLQLQVSQMRNKTHRLSDEYLDLDLLDQQARDILGLVRSEEIVIQ